MYYLFIERPGQDAQLFEGGLAELKRVAASFDALGWSTTILDEEERAKFRAITEGLIAQRPDLT